MSIVTVITADVIRSRHSNSQLEKLPSALTELAHPLLIAPFTVYRGDEVQGVCHDTLRAPELLRHLRFACLPLRLRIGVGVGQLESGADSGDSWKMNGSAFVRAREALDSLKKGQRARTAMRSWDREIDVVGCALLELMDVVERRWTDHQWQAVHAYERLGTYESAGEFLGVALQNIEKRCRAANWTAIKQAEEALTGLGKLLERYLLVTHP